ncbi:MAG: TIGR00266 family protein [Polyangiaceae bacterium]|nr:TIGR00266 family protein [Polyangiaceae bacterium]
MKHEVLGGADYGLLQITFEAPGERVVAESGALLAMDSEIEISTSARGGLLGAAKRKLLGGESIFQNTFTAKAAGQRLWLAPPVEGELKAIELQAGEVFYLQSGAYVAQLGEQLKLNTQWGGVKGFFSGVGLFLLKVEGPGTVFFGGYGALHPVVVDREGYTADTGHIVAFTSGLNYQVRTFGGMKGLFLSGEGLICDFQGHGTVYLQTRDPHLLADFLHPFRPVQSSNS